MTTPAEEAQSAARAARRNARREGIASEVHVDPVPTLPDHVYRLRREVELQAADPAFTPEPVFEVPPTQPDPDPEPAPEPKKTTRSRKAAA